MQTRRLRLTREATGSPWYQRSMSRRVIDDIVRACRGVSHVDAYTRRPSSPPPSRTSCVQQAREAASRPDPRFHDLRHVGAPLATASGATLAEPMQRLGHTTVSAALAYQHAVQGSDV